MQPTYIARDEMQALCEAWDRAKAGKPQLVVLLADSGLGKTRLIQEFYHQELATAVSDPQGYWPRTISGSGESLPINPQFPPGTVADGKFPWLWWGLRCLAPKEESKRAPDGYSAVTEAAPLLLSHFGYQEHAAQTWQEFGRLAFSAVKAAAGVAGSLTDIIVGVAAAVQQMSQPAKTVAGAQAQHRESAADLLSNLLIELLTWPQGKPVVVVLDDAQWIDPLTLEFMTSLLFSAARRAPGHLLVLVTHWEKQWNDDCLAFETATARKEEAPPAFASLVQRLKAALYKETLAPDDPGHLRILRIPLLVNILPMVAEAFPAMPPDDQLRIASKSGGNPEACLALIRHLQRSPRAYLTREGALTRDGRTAIANIPADAVIFTLYRERIAQLDEALRQLLESASLQGMQFREDLLAEFFRCLTDPQLQQSVEQVLEHLATAKHPEAIIEPVSPSFHEFRQQLLRDLLHQSLHLRPVASQAFHECLQGVLRDWISQRWDWIRGLPSREQAPLLELARAELPASSDSPSDAAAARAKVLAALVRLYRSEWKWQAADAPAREFAQELPEAGWTWDVVPFWDQIEVLDSLEDWRQSGLALKLGLLMLERARSDRDGNPDDAQAWRNLAVALSRVGGLQAQGGERADALASQTEALDIFRDIVARWGEARQSLRDVALALQRVGDLQAQGGERAAALKSQTESLALSRTIVARWGEAAESLRDVAVALTKVGDLQAQGGERADALASQTKALDIFRDIVARWGEAAESLRDVAVALTKVGDLLAQGGERAAALQSQTESLRIGREIVARWGEAPQSLRDVAVALTKVGDLQAQGGERADALASQEESLALCRTIVARWGEAPESLLDVALGLAKVAALVAVEQPGAAREHVAEALALILRIIQSWGEPPQLLHDQAVLEQLLAFLPPGEDEEP